MQPHTLSNLMPAISDAILLIIAISIYCLLKINIDTNSTFKRKTLKLWQWVFILLAISALIGTVIHGAALTKKTSLLLWQGLDLIIEIMPILIFVSALYEAKLHVRYQYIILAIGLLIIFYVIKSIFPQYFFILSIYAAFLLMASIVIYVLAGIHERKWHLLLRVIAIIGIIFSLYLQALTAIKWQIFSLQLDNNSLFHFSLAIICVILYLSLTPLKHDHCHQFIADINNHASDE